MGRSPPGSPTLCHLPFPPRPPGGSRHSPEWGRLFAERAWGVRFGSLRTGRSRFGSLRAVSVLTAGTVPFGCSGTGRVCRERLGSSRFGSPQAGSGLSAHVRVPSHGTVPFRMLRVSPERFVSSRFGSLRSLGPGSGPLGLVRVSPGSFGSPRHRQLRVFPLRFGSLRRAGPSRVTPGGAHRGVAGRV